MGILTKELEAQLQAQYDHMWDKGTLAEVWVICKVYHKKDPSYAFYLISQDPRDTNFFYAVIKGEGIRSINLEVMESIKIEGEGCEVDPSFEKMKLKELYRQLNKY